MDNRIDAATNTFNQIGIINTDKTKKKPYDVKIKNNNPNEPKLRKSQILYSDKQNYRRYKTKIEPKLFSKIMVDDEEDLIAKIRKEFGIEDKTRKNYSEAETSGVPYYEEPNPIQGEEPNIVEMLRFELSDLSRNDMEDLLGEDVAPEPFEYNEDEEEPIYDNEDVAPEPFEYNEEEEEEPEPLSRKKSGLTELSALTTKPEEIEALSINDLYLELEKRGEILKGRKPSTDEGIKKKQKELIKLIKDIDKERGAT